MSINRYNWCLFPRKSKQSPPSWIRLRHLQNGLRDTPVTQSSLILDTFLTASKWICRLNTIVIGNESLAWMVDMKLSNPSRYMPPIPITVSPTRTPESAAAPSGVTRVTSARPLCPLVMDIPRGGDSKCTRKSDEDVREGESAHDDGDWREHHTITAHKQNINKHGANGAANDMEK